MPKTITIDCIVDIKDKARRPELCRLEVPFEYDGVVYENIGLLKREDLSSAIFKIESHRMPDGCNIEMGIKILEYMTASSGKMSRVSRLANGTPLYKLCMMGTLAPNPGLVRFYSYLQHEDIAGMMLHKYSRRVAEMKEKQRLDEEREREEREAYAARKEAERLRQKEEDERKISDAEAKVAKGGPDSFTLNPSTTVLLIEKYGIPCPPQTKKMLINRDVETKCHRNADDGKISVVSYKFKRTRGQARINTGTIHEVMEKLFRNMLAQQIFP